MRHAIVVRLALAADIALGVQFFRRFRQAGLGYSQILGELRHPLGAVRHAEGRIEVTVAGADKGIDGGDEAAVWLAVFDRQHETAIRRGENGGRTLKYHNVVRNMMQVGTWTGKPLKLTATLADLGGHPDGCAVIVQSVKTGRILGAAKVALPKV